MYKGRQIVDLLGKYGIDPKTISSCLSKINSNDQAKACMSQNMLQSLKSIEFVTRIIMTTDGKANAFCFKRRVTNNVKAYGENITGTKNTAESFSFCFWLLDPTTIFRNIASQTRSIVLLSGTLTPFTLLCSELNHKFTHQIIAPHILKKNQVYISNISYGHLNRELSGTYKESIKFEYLDQIALIIK